MSSRAPGLLQRKEEKNLCEGHYDDISFSQAAWYAVIGFAKFSTSRVIRKLVDAGADTAAEAHFHTPQGETLFDGTPLAFTNKMLREKKVLGATATEAQLHNQEATRRLLVRVEAVHAVSWLWQREAAPSVTKEDLREGLGPADEGDVADLEAKDRKAPCAPRCNQQVGGSAGGC